MLTVIRDAGRLQAVCEWWLVDDEGRFEPKGRYVWVNQLELNPGLASSQMIQQIIQQISALVPWAVGAYWERRDKTEGMLHAFRRDQLVKEVSV